MQFYKNAIKHFIDLTASLVILLITSPVLITIWFLLLVNNKGYPFFIQARPGKNSVSFNLIKFKTMNDKRDGQGKLLPDAERLTKVGAFIRKYSLDELPQLINILKGDMSLVGPRPLLIRYLSKYTEEQARRHEVKPGITGWAQVNGRNAISWEEKFKYDVYYVDHLSFKLDMKILWLTFLKVINSEGINASNTITMKPFEGTKTDH